MRPHPREIIGHGRDCLGRDHHVLGVAAIVADARNLLDLAENEIAATAGVADKTVPAMPSHAHALTGLPLRDVSSNGVDAPGDLVAGNSRVLQSGKARLLHDGITVTDAAGLHLDPDLRPPRLRNGAFHYLEISTRFADLCDFHIFFPNGQRSCRNHEGAPSSSLRFLERQGGDFTNKTRFARRSTSGTLAPTLDYLYLSAMKSAIDW